MTEGPLATGLSLALALWCAAVVVVSGVAIVRAELRRRRSQRPCAPRPSTSPPDAKPSTTQAAAPGPSVLVLRPCAGLEPHLRRTLRSTARLRSPDEPADRLRVVLSTSTHDDPAVPLLHETAAWLRREHGIAASVEVAAPRGSNLKASQLATLADAADEDIVLVIDSDVALEGLDLRTMLAPLRTPHPRVGAVWCPPAEPATTPRGATCLGDRISAAVLGGSLHAFVLLGELDPRAMVGKTFAVRRDALRAAGGFGGLVQHLGEDMELARRLAAAGWTTEMSPLPVCSLAAGRRPRDVLARFSRWLMVIRMQRPSLLWTYPLLLAATPGLVITAAIGGVLGLPAAPWVLAAAALTRLVVAGAARRLHGRSTRPGSLLLDSVLADALLLAAFVRAAFGPPRVQWRKRWLRLGAHGRLEPG